MLMDKNKLLIEIQSLETLLYKTDQEIKLLMYQEILIINKMFTDLLLTNKESNYKFNKLLHNILLEMLL